MPEGTTRHDLIVVGASSGGIDALKVIIGGLPAALPAAVLVVVHTSPDSPRLLADILNRAGPLPCQYAQDQEVIRPGHLYLAPPNAHLLVEPGRLRVRRGPRENRARPAIDPLFRTAAVAYGQQQHPHQGQQQPSGASSGAPQQATSPHQGHHPSHHPQQPHPMSTAHGAAGQESTDYGSAHLRERHHAPHHVNHHPHHAHHHRQASSMVHHSSAPSPPRGIATAAYGTQPQLQQ